MARPCRPGAGLGHTAGHPAVKVLPSASPLSDAAGRRSRRWLGACLAVVLVGSLVASLIQSSWGRVQVTGLRIPAHNGQWIAADLLRPRSATAERPAPLVIVVPGFQRSKETLSHLSLELARRGMVVLALDPYAQGNSSSSLQPRSASTEGYGLFAVVELVADTGLLDYVDKTRIGATGHSAGGNAAILAAAHFGRRAVAERRPSRLNAVFVSGYALSFTDRVLRDVRSNAGASYALHDEGAYRNELKHGDMRRAPEALRFVNTALGGGFAPVATVEMGRAYGDAALRGLRIFHNEPLIHPLQPYSREATANQIAFFQKAFECGQCLPATDQVWMWKELCTALSLLAALTALVPAARLLLDGVPWFRGLVHPVPAKAPRPRGRARVVFWTLLGAGAVVACLSYIPMTELSQRLFPEATSRTQTWFFPQRMNNAVMLWALLNGAVGFLLFWLGRRLTGAAGPVEGARTSVGELGRTAALAFVLFAGFFGLLFAVHYFLHVDYRFVFLGARAFQPELFGLLLMYAPAFLPFFLANSLRANCAMRHEGVPEWRSRLLAAVANALGLFLILFVQYAWFAAHGTVYWTDGWLYINLLFAVVPIMAVLPVFHRCFFELTGRIYLGPLTMCPLFIMILVSNTVCYVPF